MVSLRGSFAREIPVLHLLFKTEGILEQEAFISDSAEAGTAIKHFPTFVIQLLSFALVCKSRREGNTFGKRKTLHESMGFTFVQ
jgi:hypothetical protein